METRWPLWNDICRIETSDLLKRTDTPSLNRLHAAGENLPDCPRGAKGVLHLWLARRRVRAREEVSLDQKYDSLSHFGVVFHQDTFRQTHVHLDKNETIILVLIQHAR